MRKECWVPVRNVIAQLRDAQRGGDVFIGHTRVMKDDGEKLRLRATRENCVEERPASECIRLAVTCGIWSKQAEVRLIQGVDTSAG